MSCLKVDLLTNSPIVVLQLRVYAFYSQSRKILALLTFAFMATLAIMTGLIAKIILEEKGKIKLN